MGFGFGLKAIMKPIFDCIYGSDDNDDALAPGGLAGLADYLPEHIAPVAPKRVEERLLERPVPRPSIFKELGYPDPAPRRQVGMKSSHKGYGALQFCPRVNAQKPVERLFSTGGSPTSWEYLGVVRRDFDSLMRHLIASEERISLTGPLYDNSSASERKAQELSLKLIRDAPAYMPYY